MPSRRSRRWAFDQQGDVALAPQQGLQPVDEAQRRLLRALALGQTLADLLHQPAQSHAALVTQRCHAGLRDPGAHPLGQRGWQAFDQGLAVHGQRPRPAAAAACRAAGGLAVAQQGVELRGHQFADLAQAVEHLAGVGIAQQAQAARDPAEVGVVGRQQVRLLVVQVLDAVLHAAQELVGRGQLGGDLGLHQPALGQALQRAHRGARADLGEVAAAHHQHQLHDELDLADATARQLHVVGAFGAASGAPLCFLADLAVQLPQAFEDAVVQVAPVDEGRDQRAQRQGAAAGHRLARRHDAALQPGEALPLAALYLQVLFQHRQTDHRRARVAVGPQCQIDAEHEAVVGGVADQRIEALGDEGEVFVRAGRPLALGLSVVFVDVDEIDVGRDVELARAELAHADDPEVDGLALCVQRRAMALVGVGTGLCQRDLERGLGQRGHRCGDGLQRCLVLDVQHGQSFQHQLSRHTQRRRQGAALLLELAHEQGDAVEVGRSRRQQRQLRSVSAPDPLHETAVVGAGGECREGGGFGSHGPELACAAGVLDCSGIEAVGLAMQRKTAPLEFRSSFPSHCCPSILWPALTFQRQDSRA